MKMKKLFKVDEPEEVDELQQKQNKAAEEGFADIFLGTEWGDAEPQYGPELDKAIRRVGE
jgi:hypothetical protein